VRSADHRNALSPISYHRPVAADRYSSTFATTKGFPSSHAPLRLAYMSDTVGFQPIAFKIAVAAITDTSTTRTARIVFNAQSNLPASSRPGYR
jgi:hypothetical protein